MSVGGGGTTTGCGSSADAEALASKAAAHIALHWDGQRITHWYEKRDPKPVAG